MNDEPNQQTLDNQTVEITAPVIDTSNADTSLSTLPSNEGHVETQTTVTDATENNSESQSVEKKVPEEDPRAASKMSYLEKKANEAEQKVAKADKAIFNGYYEMLNNEATKEKARQALARDPELYESFRKAAKAETGEDLPDHSSMFSGQSAQGQNQTQGNYSNTKPQSEEELTTKITQKIRDNETVEKFQTAVPEMDPKNAKDDFEKYRQARNWQAVLANASILLEDNPKLTRDQALIEGWNAIPTNKDKQIKQAEKIGEMAGMATANAANVGVGTNVSGGDRTTEPKNVPTESDREVFRKLGIKTDDQIKSYMSHKNGEA